MFTRNAANGAQLKTADNATAVSDTVEDAEVVSIISKDLSISGQDIKIVSQGTLQVDGDIKGIIEGSEVIIGSHGRVEGSVSAQRVVVDGHMMGTIRAAKVLLRKHARVDGDVHHSSLSIDEGAMFEGRSRRQEDPFAADGSNDRVARSLAETPPATGGVAIATPPVR